MKQNAKPEITEYLNYREYLRDCLEYFQSKKITVRSLEKKCGFKSSGYLKRLINGSRIPQAKSIKRIAEGFQLKAYEIKYFSLMIDYCQDAKTENKAQIYEQMLKQTHLKYVKSIDDMEIYSHWLYSVILVMLDIEHFQKKSMLMDKLSRLASSKEIAEAIAWLSKKKYISEKNGRYLPNKNIKFQTYDDKKRILEIQLNHIFYLNLAKHRLSMNLKEREYQGLILSLPKSKFPEVQKILRDTLDRIEEEYAFDTNHDAVYRIQIAAFEIV